MFFCFGRMTRLQACVFQKSLKTFLFMSPNENARFFKAIARNEMPVSRSPAAIVAIIGAVSPALLRCGLDPKTFFFHIVETSANLRVSNATHG